VSYAKRTDKTHAEIRRALRACGLTVRDTSYMPGFVDFLVVKGGIVHLVEAKTPQSKAGRIEKTQSQLELEQAGFPVVYLSSVDQAIAWAKEPQ
jgi:hypothetical protein